MQLPSWRPPSSLQHVRLRLRRNRRHRSALQALISSWFTIDGTGTTIIIITTGIAAWFAMVTGIEVTATATCIGAAISTERTGLQSPCFDLRNLPYRRPSAVEADISLSWGRGWQEDELVG